MRLHLLLMPALVLALGGLLRADSLDDVLARMDADAKAFKSYSANVKTEEYEKVIDEKIPSTGVMRFQRAKNGVSGIVDFSSGPKPFIVHLDGTKFQKYFPKANEIQEGNLRQMAATMDQMLLLGFSVTRDDMMRDYTIQLGSVEKVGSVQTSRIVLKPKSTDTQKTVRTIELWIPDGKGYPIQEKETAPNGDYYFGTFSDLQVNPQLPPSAFELPAAAAKAKRTKLN
jgi:outer membrane lipoprotein-sorting protein